MNLRTLKTLIGLLFFAAIAVPLHAAEVAKADLRIVGVSLAVDVSNPIATGIDIPGVVQTIFGGQINDAAPPAQGMSAVAELTGPGLDTPIRLTAVPGRQFILPPLHQAGEYSLQNIRLVGADGGFLQQAVPAFATITVSDILKSNVTVHQLTPDELRQRGISVDDRNYDVYEYTFVFGIHDQFVQVPYVVAIDRRTHESVQLPKPDPYDLPTPKQPGPPPRFQPPQIIGTTLRDFPEPGGPGGPPSEDSNGSDPRKRKPVIPAAIVLPTGFGVLHQFFAVILNVTNNAPAGTSIQLDSISATMDTPLAMRVVKTNPSVAIGQAVPIHDKVTGATFLIAQAEASADWSLEALKPGTHTVSLNVHATYKNPGQPDIPMGGTLSATIVVSDPRFQINFVHPDVVRSNEKYTAYAFITNTSAQSQTVRIDTTDIPSCGSGFSGNNVCRTEGDGITNLTLAPGEMKPVPYKLTSKITGRIFAAAGNADEGISLSVKLTMGVSASGIPLSPATLLLPHYAQYVNQDYVAAQLGILGLGYSLATAPTNRAAAFPRVIQNDVFQRAQDIARAGERIFVARRDAAVDDPAEDREPIFHLALDHLSNIERVDQLPNSSALAEWDQLRRQEEDGRLAAAAMARELERVGLAGGKSATQFVDDFAAATSHRTGYVLALVHGATVSGNDRPYAITLNPTTPDAKLAIPSEAASGWVRTLPFAELDKFNVTGESAELAMVGRWNGAIDLQIAAAGPQFTVELIYPDTAEGSLLRTSFVVSNADASTPVKVHIDRGARVLTVTGATASPVINAVPQTPLRIVAAAQDLFLDGAGHIVSLLFNRPITGGDPLALRNLFALTTKVAAANYEATRKNKPTDPNAPIVIPGAAASDDLRLINVTFDKTLSKNAIYTIGVDPINDRLTAGVSVSSSTLVPRIDNNAPGGIVYGKVLRGDNTEIPNVLVQLDSGALPSLDGAPPSSGRQYDTTLDHGDYLFEFIPRDIDRGANGGFSMQVSAEGKFTQVDGVVRLPGEAQRVNIVFLGRGSVNGHVRYSDGTVAKNAIITIGNTHYNTFIQEFRRGISGADGAYNISDVPVGPLTIAAQDEDGNVVYAANQIRVPGEALTQDLVFQKRELAGFATVRVTVRRSDVTDPTKAAVPNAHVGVYTQGYGLLDGFTDSDGKFTFSKVPAGFISLLAAEFSITRESAGIDLDLRPDTTIDQVLTLHVPTAAEQAALVTVEGTVWRDDPTDPGNADKDVRVKNAVITVRGFASVTATDLGDYSYPGIPTSLSDKRIVDVFDPNTGRTGTFALPTLHAGTNPLKIRLSTTVPQGLATLRVRLLDAGGAPVTGYRVIWPGFPPDEFAEKGNGIYEWADVKVPVSADVWAVAVHHPKYGDQTAHGALHADFDGQIATLELRLPGQGTILGKIEVRKPCPTPPTPCIEGWDPAFGPMAITYPIWDEAEQELKAHERITQADTVTGITTITKVPVGFNVPVETVDHPSGFASSNLQFAYDGQTLPVTLRLSSLGDVTGRVLSFDGQTPVAGASVTLVNNVASFAPVTTSSNGTFKFAGVPANTSFTVVAEGTQDGVYRAGFVDARTPQGGGPVGGLAVIMGQQAKIEGNVVDLNGNPVPLAEYWVRELGWPHRSFGSAQNPLSADKNGHFVLTNLFVGGFRVSAKSPTNQEVRGDAQGEIKFESDNQTNVVVRIGGAGSGSVSVTVVDSNTSFSRVPNAEVTLRTANGSSFDFTTTDANGNAFFDQVPAGNYTVYATAKAVARTGASDQFTVVANGVSPIQVTLTFLGKVTGTLTDPENTPATAVRGAPVTLNSGVLETHASTGSAGDFQFIGVPEGSFRLMAVDIDSGRRAFSTGDNFISKLFPERNVALSLEQMASLNVKAYLPNDAGGPGALAPLVNVKVTQRRGYSRELQGNDITFPKMFQNDGFGVVVTELGGENREVSTGGSFAPGVYTGSVTVVFATSGSVKVKVTADDPTLINGAKVVIGGPNKTATLFCDSTGIVAADGFSLGPINVQVTSANLSAAASGTLASHSVPLSLDVKLGSRAAIKGYVEAEEGVGQPSVGTRVLVDVSSSGSSGIHLETRTDAAGQWQFTGIPVANTNISIRALGPDDVTIGATASAHLTDGSTGLLTMPSVKLDATPPRVVSIEPANNANSVSPNAQVVIGFSEPIGGAYLSTNYFTLMATDDSTFVAMRVDPEVVNGVFRVRLTPNSLLKSNVVYALTVSDNIHDLTGNKMRTVVGAIFTTVNYTEPKIVRVDPPVELPLPDQSTFRLKFNKPIAMSSFDAGNGGTIVLEKLDTYKGAHVADIPFTKYLDTNDPSTLIVAPTGVAIQESSFYRITVGGVRDTQTPFNTQKEPQVFDYFSFDRVKPAVAIKSPVPATFPLIAGVHYTASATVTDEGTTNPAKDVAWVDWFDTDGTNDTFRARVRIAPYNYDFTAPAGTTYTLKASATDLSGNTGALSSFTWTVKANEAPKNVAVVNTPAAVYLNGTFASEVTFDDEGLVATVSLQVVGKKTDGSPYTLPATAIHPSVNQQVTRTTVDAAWPSAKYTVDVPPDAKEGEPLVVTATVTDSINQSTSKSANVDLTVDAVNPVIATMTPAAETHFKFNDTYTITLTGTDAESGIKHVTFNYDGQTVDLNIGAAGTSYNATTKVYTFSIPNIHVPAKNNDTRIHIVATVFDYHGNVATQTNDVIYEGVNDVTVPKASWISPLDGAVLPAGDSALAVKLRVKATDDFPTSLKVVFSSPQIANSPVTAAKISADTFEAPATLATTADGTQMTITATVSDDNPLHDVILPITIDAVTVDQTIPDQLSITAGVASQYAGKTVVVKGSSAVLYVTTPLTLKNLIVLSGGRVGNPDRVKLDLTITDRLYVDGFSSIDLTSKGYLGAWQRSEDLTFTNSSPRGMTRGDTTTATGALSAAASHAGLGASDGALNPTNATYGSITDPSDFGAGGGGSPACCVVGANGGGAVALHASAARVVLAGSLLADGGQGLCGSPCIYGPGAGGSISLTAKSLITGPATRITANGGDDNAFANVASGAGGGRVSVRVTDRLDLDPAVPVIQARGGRNGNTQEGANYIDGGAGTVFLSRPGAANGQLIVSSSDERFSPTSTHLTRGTPLAGALTFDSIVIGPRTLARFDNAYTVPTESNFVPDPTALVLLPADQPQLTATTVPAAGSSLPQGTNLAVTYTATAKDGIGFVRLPFDGAAAETIDTTSTYPAAITNKQTPLTVSNTATLGPATLKLHAETRAGRTADTAVMSYTIVANNPPAIDQFDVTPSSLQMYAGHDIGITAAATDDISISALTLTASAGTLTSSTFTAAPHVTRTFTDTIPPTTASGTIVLLTLSATDAYPGHTPVTQTKSVTILHDPNPPSINVSLPAQGQIFDEGAGRTFTVEATITDAEVGVKRAYATLDGKTYDLALAVGRPNVYTTTVPVPNVDGADLVPKQVTVTALDYEGNQQASAAITINIRPLNDPNGPAVAWTCGNSGAIYPPGEPAKLRIFAKGNTTANGVQSVTFNFGDPATVVAATAVSGVADNYEASFTVPSVPDGTVIDVRAVATSIGGNSADLSTSFTVYAGTVLKTDTTLPANDTHLENTTLYVRTSTLTVSGHHEFTRLIVLDGGKVTHAPTAAVSTLSDLVDVKAGTMFVACTGSIDVTGKGYTLNKTYPLATPPGNGTGGSHIGIGGLWDPALASTYGSVYRPLEAGGGGDYQTGLSGGGVIRINATSIALDGAIRAEGTSLKDNETRGGAGGSIWITTTSASGAGTVSANGSTAHYGGGGGGAVSIEFGSGTSLPWAITAKTGASDYGTPKTGGAGTIYTKGPQSTYGDLLIDNAGQVVQGTTLPSLGKGLTTAGSSGATLVTDRVSDIPAYFVGHWIEVSAPNGTLKGAWKIATISAHTVTLAPNVTSGTASVAVGDSWQGVYRFDNISTPTGARIFGNDPIRIGVDGNVAIAGPSGTFLMDLPYPVSGTDVAIGGNVLLGGAITAANSATINPGKVTATALTAPSLRIKNGATLTNPASAGATPFNVNVSGTLTIETNGLLDVTGHGYPFNTTYPGATPPGNGTGGSHLGIGGLWDPSLASTFGSVYRPQEAGGGGDYQTGLNGGGVLRIIANAIANDGAIRAEGANLTENETRGGGGGSIWITTNTATGAGIVSANGSIAHYGSGGGGAVAIEYVTGTSMPWTLTAKSGTSDYGTPKVGGAGTVYVRGPQSTFGDVTIDNGGIAVQGTGLPSLGKGLALSGTSGATLVTDRSVNIPAYFVGHWVEIYAPDGTLKGTWKIATISTLNAKTVTLAPNASEPISVAVGDTWQGVYRFDSLNAPTGAKVLGNDPIRIDFNGKTVITGPASSSLLLDLPQPIVGTDIAIGGYVNVNGSLTATSSITVNAGKVTTTAATAPSLLIKSGATLANPASAAATPFNVNVSGTLTIQANGLLDVTGHGYPFNTSYPGATTPGNGTGGSHFGVGGLWDPPLSSTYGSVYRPQEAGGGGDYQTGLNGGGVLRVIAGTIANDGAIRAEGANLKDNETRGGGGGSIWITTGTATGAGTVSANGSIAHYGAGGGGAVAIEYATGTSMPWALTAKSGTSDYGTPKVGGAGVTYARGPNSTYGDAVVDNGGVLVQSTRLPAFGIGFAQAGSANATLVTDRTTDVPAYFIGHWVDITGPDGTLKGTWKIATINAKTVTLAPKASEPISIAPGDQWRGVYYFDTLKLRSAAFETADLVRLGAAVDKDAASTYVPGNLGAPVVKASLIHIDTTVFGPAVVGAVGAVTDVDQPVTVTVTNTNTGTSRTATVNADGSFSVGVSGVSGDPITLKAKDSHRFPLESIPVSVGNLTSTTPPVSSISRTTMTGDGNFRLRALEKEGSLLVASSRVTFGGAGDSDKVVRFDASVPSAPSYVETISANNNRIWDIALLNGYVYVASDDLRVINMNVTPSQLIIPDRGTDNYSISVAATNGYVFVGTDPSVGRIQIFDITNPQTPRFVRNQDLGGGINFHKLIPLGSKYLIGLTPAGTFDVNIIDRSDINNLRIVKQLAIPQLYAMHGRLVGNLLYVVSYSPSPGGVAIVDVSDPLNPTLKSTIATNDAAEGVDSLGTDVIAANGASGLAVINATDPAAASLSGSLAVPGTARDVVLNGDYAYVAADDSLAVVAAPTPPRITPSLVSLTREAGVARVTGAKFSVTGKTPLSMTLINQTSAATVTGAAVAADGSFSGTVPAAAGDVIAITATDGAGRSFGPLVLGNVPFGTSVTTVPLSTAQQNNDSAFRSQLMEVEGNNLVVTSWADVHSDKVVRFNISNPLAPVYVDTTTANNNFIWDVALKNGYAYIASDDLRVVNMNVTPSQLIIPDRGTDNYTVSVAVDGTYAFVGTDPFVGRIQIFDVTNPQAPHWLRSQDMGGGVNFAKLLTLGTSYLVGITQQGGNDVWIIDRRDINNLKITAQLPIAGMQGYTARLIGNLLYVVERQSGHGVAIVDLTNPAAPVLKSVTLTGGDTAGLDAAGSTIAVGDGSFVTWLDATDPAHVTTIGTQSVPGSAWDVRFANGALYVAHETGISVIADVSAPPSINTSLIQVNRAGGGGTVAGAKTSVGGQGPITLAVTNLRTGASISGVALAADGSFTSPITGNSGDVITLRATDANSRTAGPVVVGSIPFGASLTTAPVTIGMVNNDSAFRAQLMEIEGNNLVVASWADARSDKVLRFNISNPLAPVFVDTTSANNNFIWDMVLKNGYAYVASDDLRVINMNVTPSQLIIPDRGTDNYTTSVTVDGTYAFVGTDPQVGRLQIFDVSNPQAPHWLRNQDMGGGVNFHKLLTLGTSYLIGITPQGSNDVWIIDRRDVNNLKIAAQLAIPGMTASTARLAGSLLYVTERTTGHGVAIVDLTDPTAPVLKSVTPTGGDSAGLDASGSTIAVGDGSFVTWLDASNPSNVTTIGTQNVPGNAWDVRFANGALYVAHETGISVIADVAAPPTINPSVIAVTRDASSGGVVTGAKSAISGQGTLAVTVTNRNTGASVGGIAVAGDGSFSSPITGSSGDVIAVSAVDGNNRTAGPINVGSIPLGASVATVPITIGMVNNDSVFRARLMEIEGNNIVVTSWEGARSDKILRFDITNPLAPAFVGMLPGNNNFVWDVALKNGYAYIASDDLRVVNMNVTPSQLIVPDRGTDNYTTSVGVDGTYAFVGTDPQVGRIQIFDVSNPQAPRWLRSQDMGGGANFHKLIPLGTDYLIAVTPQGTNDVWILDRRDIHNLRVAAQLAVPGIGANNARLVGDTLYLTERFGTSIAIVDVSNPLAPVLKSVKSTNGGGAFGIDAAGSTIAVGDGSVGVTMINAANPQSPIITGYQSTPGNAWDVRFANGAMYVIHETGLSVFADVAVPPTVNTSFIQIARSASGATITGAKRAIGSHGPATVAITNATSNTTTSGIAVAADGSFSATVAANTGDTIKIAATDTYSATSGVFRVGIVPFGGVASTPTQVDANDSGFKARRVAVDGNLLVTSADNYFFDSSASLVYNVSGAAPAFVQKLSASGNARDVAVQNGVAYVVSTSSLNAFDLSVNPATRVTAAHDCSNAYSIGIDGNRAYVGLGNSCGDGRIGVYDLTNPKSPVALSTGVITLPGVSGAAYTQLLPYGTNQLVGLSTNPAHAVVIIDRTNPTALTKVAEKSLTGNLLIYKARIVGHMLYGVSGLIDPATNSVVIVDLSNLSAAPVIVKTPGIPWAIEIDPATLLMYVADGCSGLTVIDASVPASAHVIATQPLMGNSWAVAWGGTKLYFASEQVVTVLNPNETH